MNKKAFDQIMEGLNETLAIVRGEADPARIVRVSTKGLAKATNPDREKLDASDDREPYILKPMTALEFIAAIANSAPTSYPKETLPLGEWIARVLEEDHCTVKADEFRRLVGIEPAWTGPLEPFAETRPESASCLKKKGNQ